MRCTDFLARFSDFRDGGLSARESEGLRGHLDSCPSCRRYNRVVDRGVELLRALPAATPKEDFRARLQHSIYSLEEERRRRSTPKGGAGAMSAVAMVAIVAAIIFTPLLWESDPVVDLPPIVAQEPEPAPSLPPVLPLSSPRIGSLVALPVPFEGQDLWTRSNALLYQQSSLYQRHSEPSLVRTGLR